MLTHPAASQQALVALTYLRKHDTPLAQIAAGLRSAWAPPTLMCTRSSTSSPTARRGLNRALREASAEYALVDGTLVECDRVGDGRADYCGKHRRHGVTLHSLARAVLSWETVVVAAMCCWLVLAVIYNNEGWATLLDGPKLPLAEGVLVPASLMASQLLCRSGSKALRVLGYAIASVRFAVVLVVCVLIVQELYDYVTAW